LRTLRRCRPRRSLPIVSLAAALGISSLGFAVPTGSALAHRSTSARQASAPLCRGRAKRLRPGHVGFSFSCGEAEDVTAFVIQASRTLHSVYDPSYAFGCERDTLRSFDCGDIHSGAGSEGSGIALVSEPLCQPRAHLVLRVIPTVNFETQSLPEFELKGPC
jgi:hypothetical protein